MKITCKSLENHLTPLGFGITQSYLNYVNDDICSYFFYNDKCFSKHFEVFFFLQCIMMNSLGHQSYRNENTEIKYLINIQKKNGFKGKACLSQLVNYF